MHRWYGIVAVVLLFLGTVVGCRSFLYEPFRIPSEAMYPTLPEGSMVIVKKLGYGDYGSMGLRIRRAVPTAEVARGDLLLFRLKQAQDTVYVKRVIGLPGDHVQCLSDQLLINGTPVPTTALDKVESHYRFQREDLDGVSYTVARLPHRPVSQCDVMVPEGHYFMLGDNRENSRDSRHFGMVSRNHLVGSAAVIIPGASP